MAVVANSVGSRIRARREELGWSRFQLARLTGVSPKSIEALEDERVDNPGVKSVRQIAKALGVAMEELVPDEPLSVLPLPGQRLELDGRSVRRSRPKLGGRDSNPQPTDYYIAA